MKNIYLKTENCEILFSDSQKQDVKSIQIKQINDSFIQNSFISKINGIRINEEYFDSCGFRRNKIFFANLVNDGISFDLKIELNYLSISNPITKSLIQIPVFDGEIDEIINFIASIKNYMNLEFAKNYGAWLD